MSEPQHRPSFWDRFWGKVDIRGEDDCWLWHGGLSTKRGGTTRGEIRGGVEMQHRVLLAHRVALCLAGEGLAEYDRDVFVDGPHAGEARLACHRCHQRLCCNNLRHLYWGTRVENEADRAQQRAEVQLPRGTAQRQQRRGPS